MLPIASAKIFALFMIVAASVAAIADPTPLDELMTYQCARDVASLINGTEQAGPLFARDNLVFTSINSQGASPILIVNAGAGIFSISLEHFGVNRIRFELPTAQTARPVTFFVSYLHEVGARARVFDFSTHRAPVGKEILDYNLVQPRRAPELLAHLEYAIWASSAAAVTALSDGSARAIQASPRNVDCDYLERKAPPMSRSLRYNLATLETNQTHRPYSSRSPASAGRPGH